MARKGPDNRKKPGPVRDWHLWTQVGRTIDPILGRKSADPRAELEKALNPAPETPPAAGAKTAPLRSRTGSSRPAPAVGLPLMPVAGKKRSAHPAGGIEPGLKRRLERGHLPIDGTLDLHGMTQQQAFAILKRYIPARAARGDRTILVITGRGLKKTGYLQIEQKGILRAMLPIWLADPDLKPFVAGIDQAHQAHGGEGAFYIRLKRARTGDPR